MSHLTFTAIAIVEHPPRSLSDDQTEPLVEELDYTITARTKHEAHDKILDDINRIMARPINIRITGKQENK